jgi:TolB-like protein
VSDSPTEREADSIWTRLRHRKVVQWGIAYAAVAWGLLQGLAYVTATFHWPEQIQQLTTLALVIGLPIVLVLAWYHGDRAQQRVTTPEFAILTVILLLGGGAFWYYQRTSDATKDAAPTASTIQPDTSPTSRDSRPSVAVLPFENRSREADDAFFVDGIHDDILTQLSKVSALRVISRSSVEQFRDTKLPMKAIADQLGVTKILEGGVQRAGERVRINVQLIDAGSDAHLWAESYDRELTAANIFEIQSEVAEAISEALKATLTPAELKSVNAVPTQNLQA